MNRQQLAWPGVVAGVVLALAGCGAGAAAQHAAAPRPVVVRTTASAQPQYPYGDVPMCAAQIEVGTADGHDYSGLSPHDPGLPAGCQALDLAHLTKAAGRALRDMLSS